jgi:hypothetical protein
MGYKLQITYFNQIKFYSIIFQYNLLIYVSGRIISVLSRTFSVTVKKITEKHL